jgi:hypothetical protein
MIPAYRSERTIAASLAGFVAKAPDTEIVVVDSAPGWESAAAAETLAGVRVIRSAEPLLPDRALAPRWRRRPTMITTETVGSRWISPRPRAPRTHRR